MHFIIALTEHRVLGFVFAPYLVTREQDKQYFEIYDRITDQSLKTYEQLLTPEQLQIVKYIENYNNQNLFKLFSKKKKLTPHSFIETLPNDIFTEHIRPFIERQITKCMEVMEYNPVPVYHKILLNKIYDSGKVEIIDKDCETVFNFDRNDEGIQYRLTIRQADKELMLTGKKAIVFSTSPCCIAIENELFVFKDIDAKKVLPFLNKEFISIPKQTEKKYLETFVRSAIAKYTVRANGFKITNVGKSPKPIISLEKNLQGN